MAGVNLSEWAHQGGVSKYTVYRWFHAGTLPVPARLILVEPAARGDGKGRTVIYARISSSDQRADLDQQVARLTSWATASGMTVGEVVTETESAMNGRRRKLARIRADPAAAQIIVEHRDRLAEFGTEHLQAAQLPVLHVTGEADAG